MSTAKLQMTKIKIQKINLKIHKIVSFCPIAITTFMGQIVKAKAQEIGVKSPDFGKAGQEFKNIGEYVVAVVERILPLIITGAVLVLVWAGLKYIISQGNTEATDQAKSLIEGVVLGLLTLFLVGLFIAFLTD